jgi:hypothetical protein
LKIHICLVSAQAAPNLLPVLDTALKPEKVVLLVSGKMQRMAESLVAVCKELGIKVDTVPLADEHSYPAIEQTLLDVATANEGHEILLNLTGGTKLMALVAHSVAVEADWRSFYVDVDTDTVTWLDRESPPQALGEQLRLRHYLRAYGFDLPDTPSRPQASRAQRELTQTLVSQIGSLEKPITQLNWLAQQAEDRRQLASAMSQAQQGCPNLAALLRHFSDAGVLRVDRSDIVFPDEAARNFAKGGWLEHHVFDAVARATGPLAIRDKAINLKVCNQGVVNEFDVALMVRNRLFAIECKTARMDKPEAPKANDTLFKFAEICRRVGGLGTRGMLASYRSLREPEKNWRRHSTSSWCAVVI